MPIHMLKIAYVNLYLQKNFSGDDNTTAPPLTPYIEDFNCGWIGRGDGIWTYENPTKCYLDIYSVLRGHQYFLTLGDIVGSRFRVMFTTQDVSIATGKVTGVAVNSTGFDNPAPYQNISYSPVNDGFIIVQKDNLGKNGIKTYLYDKGKHNVLCYPLCSLDPDACDNSKILQIVQSLLPSLSDAFQLVAVKKIEGYKIIVT